MLLFVALGFPAITAFFQWWKATPWLLWRSQYPTPDTATIEALGDLFKRDWWGRTWIIQEIASARKATIVCGLRELDLNQLEDAIDHITYLVNIHKGMTNSPYLKTDYQNVILIYGILGFESLPEIRAQRYSLLYLLNQFSHHDATDPKDKVYGLLGLAQDVRNISPDYQKTVREVYVDTARKIIETNNDLNILRSCLFSDASSSMNLPSWVPNWTIKQPRSVSGTVSQRGPYQLVEDCAQRRVGVFSAHGEILEVQGVLVAFLQGEPIESNIGGIIGGMDVRSYVNSALHFVAPAVLPLYQLGQYTWRLFRWMLRHNLVPFTLGVKMQRFIRAFEAYQPPFIPSEEWRRRQPPRWHFPKSMASYNPIALATGREIDKIYTWNLVSRRLESVQDGKTVVSTYTPHGKAGDMVAFLLGAKMPILIRRENESGRFKLIGPATFTTYMDSYVWEEVKERFEQGVNELERIELT